MSPTRHTSDSKALKAILALIRCSFLYMDGRIDPPSSIHKLTISDISRFCDTGEVWSFGDPIVASMFLSYKNDSIYIGKLAVAESERGQGYGRRMIELANSRALSHGKGFLELYTRIELEENHRVFSSMGFQKAGEASHAGYRRPTYLIMRKSVV